jgi:hypothetical protein
VWSGATPASNLAAKARIDTESIVWSGSIPD